LLGNHAKRFPRGKAVKGEKAVEHLLQLEPGVLSIGAVMERQEFLLELLQFATSLRPLAFTESFGGSHLLHVLLCSDSATRTKGGAKIRVPEIRKLEANLENQSVDSLDLLGSHWFPISLPIRESGPYVFENKGLKAPSPKFKSPFQERGDHRELAAGLPEVTDPDLLSDALEGNVAPPDRAP
jgi:hypothetical protein